MANDGTVVIQVKPGVKVEVLETDELEGDREFVAKASKGLKVAIQQVSSDVGVASVSKVTMCG